MEAKTVLVTGIGGNVGQGIIRNIKSLGYPIKIIGTNISNLSAGNCFVDTFYKVPFAYERNYIEIIQKIALDEKVDVIIPSTDYEVYYLSLNQEKISCKIAASSAETASNYLDKYNTFVFHKKHNIPFASSCLPSEFKQQFKTAIAKPRKGRGSKGILKNITSCSHLSDEEYMVQEQYEGLEITSAVYSSYLTSKVIGSITMVRSLDNGATTYCKVVKDYDDKVNAIAEKIAANSGVIGSFNIQSIITQEGDVMPFEINCRISGTNSIRSHFGFKDVQYMIDELLYNKIAVQGEITTGEAYRYLADVIYPTGSLTGTKTDKHIVF